MNEVTFVQAVYDALRNSPDGLDGWRGKLAAARIGRELGQREATVGRNDNLPPGVTENMIPGNRTEDREDEAFWDDVDDYCHRKNLDIPGITDMQSPVSRLIQHVRETSFSQGYAEGDSDAQEAQREQLDGMAEELDNLRRQMNLEGM